MSSDRSSGLRDDKRFRIGPLAKLFLERLALVDFQLPVVADANGVALERTRRRAFEIDPVLIKTATVARTFELLLAFEPVRRATKVRANGLQRIDLLPAVVFAVHDPNAVLADELGFHRAGRKVLFKADFESI